MIVWAPRSWALTVFATVLTVFAAAGQAGQVEDIRGEALIIDGDSLEVAGRRFDLAGIDAPELNQHCRKRERFYDCGSLAQAALMDLTAGVEVECRQISGKSSDGADLAHCSAGGYNLSEGMIYTGWALVPPPGAVGSFTAIQTQAEERQRGLWEGTFVTPWDWRSGTRLPGE